MNENANGNRVKKMSSGKGAPDGGWGWVIVLAALISMMLISVVPQNFSLLFANYLLQHDTSTAKTALAYNLIEIFWDISGIVAGPLIKTFSFRKVGMAAGILMVGSTIFSAFAPNPDYLCLIFSIPHGIGCGLLQIVSLTIYPHYFSKRIGKVNGIVMAGNSLSLIFTPLFLRLLQEHYGDKGSILIIGAILLNVCAAASVFHPVRWHYANVQHEKKTKISAEEVTKGCLNPIENSVTIQKNDNNQLNAQKNNSSQDFYQLAEGFRTSSETQIDLNINDTEVQFSKDKINEGEILQQMEESHSEIIESVNSTNNTPEENNGVHFTSNLTLNNIIIFLKHTLNVLLMIKYLRVLIIAVSSSLTIMACLNYTMYLPFVLLNKGYSMDIVAYYMTLIGVFNTISRISVSFLYDHVNLSSRWFIIGGTLAVAISNFTTAAVTNIVWLWAVAGLYGLGVGMCISMVNLEIIEIMGPDLLPEVLGLRALFSSVILAVFGPVIGYIRDISDDYGSCLYILGGIQMFSMILWLLMPLAKYA